MASILDEYSIAYDCLMSNGGVSKYCRYAKRMIFSERRSGSWEVRLSNGCAGTKDIHLSWDISADSLRATLFLDSLGPNLRLSAHLMDSKMLTEGTHTNQSC